MKEAYISNAVTTVEARRRDGRRLSCAAVTSVRIIDGAVDDIENNM